MSVLSSEVCVIGGGPAGLVAALSLAKSGREVTVLDCALPPIDKACGEGLMPDSLEALGRLGVTQLKGQGHSFSGIKFIGSETSVAANFPTGHGLGVRRLALHEHLILCAERAGVRMHWGVKDLRTCTGKVDYAGGQIRTQLIIGADGQQSKVRRDAGLEQVLSEKRRYGFRRHYQVQPWSPFVEIYWAGKFQIYVTPVAADCVCVALISRDPAMRLEAGLAMTPELQGRLAGAKDASSEKGSLSISRRFRRVCKDGVVLLGDASGSVDAITGEGMCLAFKQAGALVEALEEGNLQLYERQHRALERRPHQMAWLMLMLDGNPLLQRKALAALAAHPPVFESVMALHVGHTTLRDLCSWRLLHFGLNFVAA